MLRFMGGGGEFLNGEPRSTVRPLVEREWRLRGGRSPQRHREHRESAVPGPRITTLGGIGEETLGSERAEEDSPSLRSDGRLAIGRRLPTCRTRGGPWWTGQEACPTALRGLVSGEKNKTRWGWRRGWGRWTGWATEEKTRAQSGERQPELPGWTAAAEALRRASAPGEPSGRAGAGRFEFEQHAAAGYWGATFQPSTATAGVAPGASPERQRAVSVRVSPGSSDT